MCSIKHTFGAACLLIIDVSFSFSTYGECWSRSPWKDLMSTFFFDEAVFNLAKARRGGRNTVGQRAIVQVPGHRGGYITLGAAIGNHRVLHHHANLGWSSRCAVVLSADYPVYVGQPQFSQKCPDTGVGPHETAIPKCSLSTILPFPHPDRRIFHCMAVEGV